jgi:SAM-dependent methyltransferase
MKTILHAGCGSISNKVPDRFKYHRDTRLDLNRNVKPDIVASIVAMPMVDDESFDAVHCSHCLEHLTAVEGALALREFLRVLKPGGELSLQVPDLQAIGGKIGLGQIDYVLYTSAMGPITPLDMLYGMQSAIGAGNLFMAHKMGFTAGSLERILTGNGFERVATTRGDYELFATAFKGDGSDQTEHRTNSVVLPQRAGLA